MVSSLSGRLHPLTADHAKKPSGVGNGLTVDIGYSSTSFEDRVEDHLLLVIPGRLSARKERRDGELELIGADIRAWTLGRWNRALTGGGGSTNPSGLSKGRSTTRWVEEEAEAAEGDLVVRSSPERARRRDLTRLDQRNPQHEAFPTVPPCGTVDEYEHTATYTTSPSRIGKRRALLAPCPE